MNYKFFRDPVLEFIARGDDGAAEFDRALAPGRLIYAEEGVRAMMNLIDSHDTERFLTTAGGDVRRLKLAAALRHDLRRRADDLLRRRGRHDRRARPRLPAPVPLELDRGRASASSTHDYFRKLATLRTGRPCFTRGDFETLLADGDVFAFRRGLGDDQAVVVLNAGVEEATVS